jgi:hypothetical protein
MVSIWEQRRGSARAKAGAFSWQSGRQGAHLTHPLRANHCILPEASEQSGPEYPMNAPGELNYEEMLRIRLGVLKREHRDLDDAIAALQERAIADPLVLRRLKKQKLALKDQIVKIEDQLIPDIIA